MRTGLHTGEAQIEHGDYFGAALSRAARLRALGRGGQVLVSQATAELVADRLPAGVSLRDLGRVQLRGFGRAEQVHQMCAPFLPDTGDPITLAGPEADSADAPPVPDRAPSGCDTASSAAPTSSRRSERRGRAPSTLRNAASCWSAATRASARAGSPPSSPATSTTTGATVLFGRCYEENVAPYQPFVEAVEQYLRHGDPAEVRADLVRSGTILARLVPDIGLRFPDLPEPVRAEPDTERYLMFEAVDALLARIAKRAPLLVVLDDLHWADRPTLALLSHLARHADAAPLVVLGTYRVERGGRGSSAAPGHGGPAPRRRLRGDHSSRA